MKKRRPAAVPRLVPQIAGDDLARAVSDLATAQQRTEGQREPRARLTVDLQVGENRLVHGLGRAPHGCSVTPTVADATFGWALTERSSTQLTITVVGTGQPSASIEVW